MAQRRVEDRGEPVNPLAGLWLPHPEEQALHRLDGIEPEMDQDEHQPVRRARPAAPAILSWRVIGPPLLVVAAQQSTGASITDRV